jgi:hypothetical protein
MRRIGMAGMALFTLTLASAEEFTGWLTDAKCAKGGKAASSQHGNCARKCVEAGGEIVLLGEEKVYKIKNQDKVRPYVGSKVAVQATLTGDTLEVETGRYLEQN